MLKSFDDLSPEQKKVSEKVASTRSSNAYRVAKMESIGVVLDTGVARVDHMLDSMCEQGIITVDQLLKIHLAWETSFAEQLDEHEKEIKHRIQAAQREQAAQLSVAKKSGLVDGQGRPLRSI